MISRRGILLGAGAGAVSVLPIGRAFAQDLPRACSIVPQFAKFAYALPRVAEKIANKQPLHILALGSSSTAGARASSPDKTYPSILRDALAKIFPDSKVTVDNRGVNGAMMSDMMIMLGQSLESQKPDLVLLQAGTNTILKDQPIEPAVIQIFQAIEIILERGIDVILINSQRAPKIDEKAPAAQDMHARIDAIGNLRGVNVFNRHGLNTHWLEAQGMKFAQFVHEDGIHYNDWGYRCWALNKARAIADAAKIRPVYSNAAYGL